MVTDLLSLFVLAIVIGAVDEGFKRPLSASVWWKRRNFSGCQPAGHTPAWPMVFQNVFRKKMDAEYTFLLAILFVYGLVCGTFGPLPPL